jgi:hypothetical protein
VESLELELQRANAEIGSLRDERRKIADSKWLRLGRALGFGPVVESD